MEIILASSNRHKYEEIAAVLPPSFQLKLSSDLNIDSPAETGDSFIANALIKARYVSGQCHQPALADDSGLAVDTLDGEPGIYSARFAGSSATDSENNQLLIQRMLGKNNRQAAFHCALVFVESENSQPLIAEGIWRGEILESPRGTNGFGYDPLFYIPELGLSAAELSAHEKNQYSHRALALKTMMMKIREHYST